MSDTEYLHGFDDAEQARLVAQSEYFRHTLIPVGLDYRPGERLLDVGCAAGATLAMLAERFPGVRLAGLDREPRQVAFARDHLGARGLEADLREGDATRLPWPDDTFDHVYVMWFLEHLTEEVAQRVLSETRRVLRPGGTITVTETDYGSFVAWPPSRDWDELLRAQWAWFEHHGNPATGRRLGTMLHAAGFAAVTNRPVGFHAFHGASAPGVTAVDARDMDDPAAVLRAHTDYLAGFLEPAIPPMAALGFDEAALRRGLAHLRSLPDREDGATTQVVYRAQGVA